MDKYQLNSLSVRISFTNQVLFEIENKKKNCEITLSYSKQMSMAIDHDLSHKLELFLIEIAKRQLIVLVILSSKWKLFDQSYVNAK